MPKDFKLKIGMNISIFYVCTLSFTPNWQLLWVCKKDKNKCLIKILFSTEFCLFTHDIKHVSFSWNNFVNPMSRWPFLSLLCEAPFFPLNMVWLQPLHQLMHTAILLHGLWNIQFTNHESHKVATCINHRKNDNIKQLGIPRSTNMLPWSPTENIPSAGFWWGNHQSRRKAKVHNRFGIRVSHRSARSFCGLR